MRERWCRAAVGLLLLGACSDGGGADEAAPTTETSSTAPASATPTSTTSTTSTVPADPFAVPPDPADIDEAYVERVANELYRVNGDATRVQMAGGDLEEVVARYRAIFDTSVVDAVLTNALDYAAEGFPNSRNPRGNARVKVSDVQSARSSCIAASVVQDVSEVVEQPPAPFSGTLILRQKAVTTDPDRHNKTPWVMERIAPQGDAGASTCDSSE